MLEELRKFENLGTPNYFHELLTILHNNKWTKQNVQEYFFNRIIDGKEIYDGCLLFLELIEIIKINNDNHIILDSAFLGNIISVTYLKIKILERLFTILNNDRCFHSIFCTEHVTFDVIYHSPQINNSAFHFKYSNFKQLLIDFDFLLPHPEKNIRKLIINKKYKRFFDKNILPEIKKKMLGIEELKKQLEQKQIYGEEAENFVLNFEKQRLNLHKKIGDIEKISEYDSYAGYDIISFNNNHSEEIDRFIEVKSYEGIPNFYWSKNQVYVSKIKTTSYFLYLVDRKKMQNKEYNPMIIQNPYVTILKNDEWIKEIDKWLITLKND